MSNLGDPPMSQALPPGDSEALAAGADPNAAGNALRAAREAAGLSIDAVAHQLKLAPRQVAALENGDYAELPGRTFVRGFARNYARLMHLDADALVAALPDASAAPALERPVLGSDTRPMGAFEERPRRSIARIAIPLLLLGLIALGAIYELDQRGALRVPGFATAPTKPVPADPVMPPPLPGSATPLPNPLTDETRGAPADAAAQAKDAAATPPVPAIDAGGLPPASVPIGGASPATGTTPIVAAAPATSTAAPAKPGEQATLVVSYRAPSWTEVRDGAGQRLLVGTIPAGSTQTITGTPPFDVVLGNVTQTTVTWRGATVDTSAYHRQNVARLHLP